ncbi:MAG TPA: CoA transferase [Dehalococcoidales bacterium]|nr:CoA transferase [Dehalococcoidales bacterium]
MEKRPLEGVKVIQLCWAGVGVYTTNFLSHYGATTVRVETSTYPDPVRTFEPYAPTNQPGEPVGLERSVFYSITHTAPELGMVLNLKQPESMEVFKKLVLWADVVAEGFPAGVMDKIGLDYEGLKKIKPDIIMMRSCGYGHSGAMAAQPGFGSIITAVTMMDIFTGWPDRRPLAPTTYYTDQLVPMYAALSILVALDYKRRTGKGQYIDQSQMESGLNFVTPLILDYQANKRHPALKGNRSDFAAPHGIYPGKGEDRWVAISVTSQEEWVNFKKVLNNPSWTELPEFSTLEKRIKNSDSLDRYVAEWTAGLAPEQVMGILQGAGIGAGVVSTSRDLDSDLQLNYYNFYRQIDHPYMGKLRYYHPAALKLSRAETEVKGPVLLGEHTDYVCQNFLGMSKAEIEDLRSKGVFK